ncbi:hypothetical protein [Aliarcobacter butzleri]|uniref:hypothetical protein n=1 Tax=Aliarcobacter butzleri TaxID=28197 RepID=UPI0012F74869|nr:hypothetical protein [Aliarcobacter butzleri]
MNNKTTHLINILTQLLESKKLSSIDIRASNSNQYFCTIKNNGIELIEVMKPNLTNRGYHLERRLNLSDDNLNKARQYLDKLKGII